MKRKNFLLSAITAMPALLLATPFKPASPDRSKKGFVVKSGDSRFGEKTFIGGKNSNDIKISQKDSNGDLSVFEYVGVEKTGPPLHMHPHQDEIFFVVQGDYFFRVGDDKHLLKAGDSIFLPRGVPHTFLQISDVGKLFFLFQPSGKMEDFFRSIGSLTAPPTPEQAAEIFSDHEMVMMGPPLQIKDIDQ